MNKLLFLLICVVSWQASGQDERYFRQLFSGELSKKAQSKDDQKYSFVVHSPYYSLDLNLDSKSEQIVFIKRDNEDWIEIYDEDKIKIYAYRFENKGFDSELYRVEFKRLGPETTVLLMSYYEGMSRYINFQGTSRMYVLTIDKNDFKTMTTFKGDSFFDEVKTFKGHYHKRNYHVYLEDLNKDSIKELVFRHNNSTKVYIYAGSGKWQTFNEFQSL